MSLILEALKKSEAQRRLGEMPNLGTPITATRRRRSPLPWIATAAVIAIAAVGGWRFLQRAAPPAPAPTPAGKDAPLRAMAKPESAAAPAAAVPRPLPKPAAPPPPVVAAPPPTAAPAPKKETPPPAPAAAAAKPALPPAPATAAAPAAATPVPPAAPPVSAAAAPAPAPAPAPPPANDVPTLEDLPPNVRSAVPTLPITMQVYSPDPKRRFVIIDGTRVVEGDSLRGVTVQEIRPSGLVIDFQGRRVLLPRPGS